MKAEIWWSDTVPDEVRQATEPLLDPLTSWLPAWVHELIVRWDPDGPDVAYASSDPGARRATVTIAPRFLQYDEGDRVDVLRHEFVHFLLHPLTSWTKRLVGSHMPDELQEWMLEEWQERLEGVTCDITRLL